MDVTPLIRKDQQIIQSYAGGMFRVSGAVYQSAITVMPSSTTLWDVKAQNISDLVLEDLQVLIDQSDDIDVVLLGCGASMDFLDAALKSALRDQGLSVDVMGSGAACRTYNVLMAEGRRVAAALLPV